MINLYLNNSYGFLLAKIEEEMEERLINNLSPLKINARQFGILQFIEDNPDSSQITVSNALFIDRTTMVAHADHLEDLGYIKRIKNPNDRRSFVLTITDQGEEKLRLGRNYLEDTELSVLSSLTKEEKEKLKSLLLKVWRSIQKEEKDESY